MAKSLGGGKSRIVSTVLKRANDKTGVIISRTKQWNHLYKVYVTKRKKIHFHDPQNETSVGDLVEIVQHGRKISTKKSWILDRIVQKHPMALGMMKDHVDSDEAIVKLYQIERDVLGGQDVRVRNEIPGHQLEMKMLKQQEIEMMKEEEAKRKREKRLRQKLNKKERNQDVL